MSLLLNPFNTVGYISEYYFCDRESELALLLENAKNSINTTLVSSRKFGKSALLYRFSEELNKENEIYFFYIDIYSTQNLREFIELLSITVLRKFTPKESFGKQFLNFVKALRPVISYDTLSGQPEISFEYSQIKEYENTLAQIFKFLDKQNVPIMIAFDEFQQIATYPEQNVEALLRTIIQTLRNVNFVFSGSHQHIMNEIFSNSKRPFFASTQSLSLFEIPEEKYKAFIEFHFADHKKYIDSDAVEFILDWTMRHTYYTQFVCKKLFASPKKKIDIHTVKLACGEILDSERSNFLHFRRLLTPFQWQLLIAIAKEEKVFKPQSKDFVQKYALGSASSVKKTLDSLTQKEMVMLQTGHDTQFYRVYDVFLLRWLNRTY